VSESTTAPTTTSASSASAETSTAETSSSSTSLPTTTSRRHVVGRVYSHNVRHVERVDDYGAADLVTVDGNTYVGRFHESLDRVHFGDVHCRDVVRHVERRSVQWIVANLVTRTVRLGKHHHSDGHVRVVRIGWNLDSRDVVVFDFTADNNFRRHVVGRVYSHNVRHVERVDDYGAADLVTVDGNTYVGRFHESLDRVRFGAVHCRDVVRHVERRSVQWIVANLVTRTVRLGKYHRSDGHVRVVRIGWNLDSRDVFVFDFTADNNFRRHVVGRVYSHNVRHVERVDDYGAADLVTVDGNTYVGRFHESLDRVHFGDVHCRDVVRHVERRSVQWIVANLVTRTVRLGKHHRSDGHVRVVRIGWNLDSRDVVVFDFTADNNFRRHVVGRVYSHNVRHVERVDDYGAADLVTVDGNTYVGRFHESLDRVHFGAVHCRDVVRHVERRSVQWIVANLVTRTVRLGKHHRSDGHVRVVRIGWNLDSRDVVVFDFTADNNFRRHVVGRVYSHNVRHVERVDDYGAADLVTVDGNTYVGRFHESLDRVHFGDVHCRDVVRHVERRSVQWIVANLVTRTVRLGKHHRSDGHVRVVRIGWNLDSRDVVVFDFTADNNFRRHVVGRVYSHNVRHVERVDDYGAADLVTVDGNTYVGRFHESLDRVHFGAVHCRDVVRHVERRSVQWIVANLVTRTVRLGKHHRSDGHVRVVRIGWNLDSRDVVVFDFTADNNFRRHVVGRVYSHNVRDVERVDDYGAADLVTVDGNTYVGRFHESLDRVHFGDVHCRDVVRHVERRSVQWIVANLVTRTVRLGKHHRSDGHVRVVRIGWNLDSRDVVVFDFTADNNFRRHVVGRVYSHNVRHVERVDDYGAADLVTVDGNTYVGRFHESLDRVHFGAVHCRDVVRHVERRSVQWIVANLVTRTVRLGKHHHSDGHVRVVRIGWNLDSRDVVVFDFTADNNFRRHVVGRVYSHNVRHVERVDDYGAADLVTVDGNTYVGRFHESLDRVHFGDVHCRDVVRHVERRSVQWIVANLVTRTVRLGKYHRSDGHVRVVRIGWNLDSRDVVVFDFTADNNFRRHVVGRVYSHNVRHV
jgi:hypothetical protein